MQLRELSDVVLCFAACVLHKSTLSPSLLHMASHLEPINAATKAVNNAMFDCQPYNAVHPHLQKKFWVMKTFNTASHVTVVLEIDAHLNFTAAASRPGCSLMMLAWHGSCSKSMFHADIQGAASRGRPKQPTWVSVMSQVVTSSMCRRL